MLDGVRRFFNYTMPGRVGAARFRIPVLGGLEARGVHESVKTRVIRRHARPEGVFVDVGANLGQTLLDLRASQAHQPYVGFEPNPRAVSYIRSLIESNGFADCKIACMALGDRAAVMELCSVPQDAADPSSTLLPAQWSHDVHTAVQPVAVLPFDEVAANVGARPVSFVKIDVEGAELEVLRGMVRALAADRPTILCEVLPPCGGATPGESAERRAALRALLGAAGYEVFHVRPDATLAAVADFSAGPFSADLSWDYLFVPEALAGSIETG